MGWYLWTSLSKVERQGYAACLTVTWGPSASAASPGSAVEGNAGVLHSRRRDARCLWEESSSLGNKGNMIRERKEQGNRVKEKRWLWQRTEVTPFLPQAQQVFRPCDLRVS